MRITDELLIAYDRTLSEVARHVVLQGHSGERRIDPQHTPPRDHEEQMKKLHERFAELGEIGVAYIEGLQSKHRNSKHQALQVLGLLHAYHKHDLLRAMQRAVQYHALGFSSLERILAHQATPKPNWQQLDETSQQALQRLSSSEPIGPRHSQEYQHLLYGTSQAPENPDDITEQANSNEEDSNQENSSEANISEASSSKTVGNETEHCDSSPVDCKTFSDAKDPAQ